MGGADPLPSPGATFGLRDPPQREGPNHHAMTGGAQVPERVFVIGAGMTRFAKPAPQAAPYWECGRQAAADALADARVSYDVIDQVTAGYCLQPSTAGQRVVYELGLTGVPVYNVNNLCASGASALMMACQLVAGGTRDCALAVGFEQMLPGAAGADAGAESLAASPLARHYAIMARAHGFEPASPPAPQLFGNAAREHMDRYATTPEQLALVAVKNHRHSVANPNAQFQDEYSVDQIIGSRMIHAPLTKLQCSPTSNGAAATVIASERIVRSYALEERAVEVVGQAMRTDSESSFATGSTIDVAGKPMTRAAAQAAFRQAGLGVEDVDVIELHDCFSINELITYEALGMCSDGKSGALVADGATTYGGRWVVNPSGGLISKGHPLGATGLAQCAELVWQLRGEAGDRQVPGARVGLAHNIGLGGAAVVTLLREPRPQPRRD
jgi:acetyl-CoA acetyltransferase